MNICWKLVNKIIKIPTLAQYAKFIVIRNLLKIYRPKATDK